MLYFTFEGAAQKLVIAATLLNASKNSGQRLYYIKGQVDSTYSICRKLSTIIPLKHDGPIENSAVGTRHAEHRQIVQKCPRKIRRTSKYVYAIHRLHDLIHMETSNQT